MKSRTPRGKTPSLIGSANGRPKRVDVKRESTCCRCGNTISAGEDCFNIPKTGTGFSTERRYCKICYGNVLDQTQKELDALKAI